MKLGALPPDAFRSTLRDVGVRLRTGPFVTRLRSPYGELADAIRYVYADHLPLDSHIRRLSPQIAGVDSHVHPILCSAGQSCPALLSSPPGAGV